VRTRVDLDPLVRQAEVREHEARLVAVAGRLRVVEQIRTAIPQPQRARVREPASW
jgi:hypothetical protein